MNLLLDGIERADSLNGLRCQWRFVQLVQVDEFSSRMRPTGGFEDLAAVVELGEARIPVGLQNAAKVFEMLLGMFALLRDQNRAVLRRTGRPCVYLCSIPGVEKDRRR